MWIVDKVVDIEGVGGITGKIMKCNAEWKIK